jgi:methionyl-tRNA formyltransferase
MKPLRLGFFGLPLAALLLQRDGCELSWSVLSAVPAPGRRRLSALLPPNAVIDLLVDDSGFERRVDSLFDASPIDLVVSWFYTRRIAEPWLKRTPLGGIGVHPSLLPRHRGADPFYWAIDAGDAETGVTVHRLEADYDTGAILAQRRQPIGELNAWQLARALDRPSLAALREVVRAYATGRFCAATTQEEALATLAPEPAGHQLHVDWHWPTERVLRRIRALAPVPGLALEVNGLEFFVQKAGAAPTFPHALLPGEAFIGPRLLLRTGDGAIVIERAQLAEQNPGLLHEGADQPPSDPITGELLAQLLGKFARN